MGGDGGRQGKESRMIVDLSNQSPEPGGWEACMSSGLDLVRVLDTHVQWWRCCMCCSVPSHPEHRSGLSPCIQPHMLGEHHTLPSAIFWISDFVSFYYETFQAQNVSGRKLKGFYRGKRYNGGGESKLPCRKIPRNICRYLLLRRWSLTPTPWVWAAYIDCFLRGQNRKREDERAALHWRNLTTLAQPGDQGQHRQE